MVIILITSHYKKITCLVLNDKKRKFSKILFSSRYYLSIRTKMTYEYPNSLFY